MEYISKYFPFIDLNDFIYFLTITILCVLTLFACIYGISKFPHDNTKLTQIYIIMGIIIFISLIHLKMLLNRIRSINNYVKK